MGAPRAHCGPGIAVEGQSRVTAGAPRGPGPEGAGSAPVRRAPPPSSSRASLRPSLRSLSPPLRPAPLSAPPPVSFSAPPPSRSSPSPLPSPLPPPADPEERAAKGPGWLLPPVAVRSAVHPEPRAPGAACSPALPRPRPAPRPPGEPRPHPGPAALALALTRRAPRSPGPEPLPTDCAPALPKAAR